MALSQKEREALKSRGFPDLDIAALDRGEAVSSVDEGFQPISSQFLQPQPDIAFKNPNVDFFTPIVTPFQPEELSQPEERAQDTIESIIESRKGLEAQEGVARIEKERELDIAGKTQVVTDLQSKLKMLQNQALAIPLQIQQEAIGRGITAGGLRPLETEALRRNAIEALGTASLLEASRGNLETAQTLVDRALEQQFGPKRKEIEAKIANLELLLASPELSLAQKNRAQKQLDIQNQKQREVEKEEDSAKQILETATEAARNGADALTLKNIQNAKTPQEALQLADPFLKKPTSVSGQGLTYAQQLQIAAQLRDDARQDLDIKVFPEVRQAYETIVNQAAKKDAVGDLTMLRLYAKLTDPTSSVREEEFESMESAQGALARLGIRLTTKQIYGTRLTDSARQQFISSAKQIYESRERNYAVASDRIRQNAIDAGLNPDRIITPQLAELPVAFSEEEKTQALNKYLEDEDDQDLGFFDQLLGMFGLQKK